jgi:hypothetical protein
MLRSRIPRRILVSLFICLCILLSALLFIQLDHGIPYVIIDPVEPPAPTSFPKPISAPKLNGLAPQQPPSNTSDINVPWMYNPQTDANRHELSRSQCYTAFGDLFQEISRAAIHRNQIGDVTATELDSQWKKYGIVRAILNNQKVSDRPFSNLIPQLCSLNTILTSHLSISSISSKPNSQATATTAHAHSLSSTRLTAPLQPVLRRSLTQSSPSAFPTPAIPHTCTASGRLLVSLKTKKRGLCPTSGTGPGR